MKKKASSKKSASAAKSRGSKKKNYQELPKGMVSEVANLIKLMADETRVRILSYLCQEPELHVAEMCKRIGQSQPAVSHHLALMREAGLLEVRKDGRFNFYRLSQKPVQKVLDLIFTRFQPDGDAVRIDNFKISRLRGKK